MRRLVQVEGWGFCVFGLWCAAFLWAGAAHGGTTPTQYIITDLGVPDSYQQTTNPAINNKGDVAFVAYSQSSSYPYSLTGVYLYTDGTPQLITATGYPAGDEVYGLNDSRQVLVETNALSSVQAMLFSNGTSTSITGLTARLWGNSFGLNASGQVVGTSTDPNTNTVNFSAFISTGGSLQTIGSFATTAINDSGQVAGNLPNSGGAVLYTGGTLENLGTPNGAPSYAKAMNNVGQVVGNEQLANGYQAVLLGVNLQTELGGLFAGGNSTAEAINDAGVIVGSAQAGSSSTATDGFVYMGGKMLDLNSLILNPNGDVVQDASGINASGQIVGTALTPAGVTHAVLLTPVGVPLPSAMWIALPTLALARGAACWRKSRDNHSTPIGYGC